MVLSYRHPGHSCADSCSSESLTTFGVSSISIRIGGESRSSNWPPRMQRMHAIRAVAPNRIATGRATYKTLINPHCLKKHLLVLRRSRLRFGFGKLTVQEIDRVV